MKNEDLNSGKKQKFDSWEAFYQSIPAEGSLGILALGARGVLAWRKKREELKKGKFK